VGFLADKGGKAADTKAIAFMNDELGLKTECVGSASGCK
jgi:hypothetical protein